MVALTSAAIAAIIAAVATVTLTATGVTLYYTTDIADKLKSSNDDKKPEQNNLQDVTVTNDRFFQATQKPGLRGTQATRATSATRLTMPTLPTIATLPTLRTGYRWQEFQPTPEQREQIEQPQVFADRYKHGQYNGPISAGSGAVRSLGSDAARVLGVPEWAGWLLALTVPGINMISTVDKFIWDIDGERNSMLQNVLVDPWVEVTHGNASVGNALLSNALNTLSGATEVFDILANPVKGSFKDGFKGFVNGLGFGPDGYVAYDWDTGNFGTDLVAEILSDPLTYASIGKAVASIAANAGKAGAAATVKVTTKETLDATQEVTQEAAENLTREAVKTFEKTFSEVVTDVSSALGEQISKEAFEDVSKIVSKTIVDEGLTGLSKETYKNILTRSLDVIRGASGLGVTEVITKATLDNLGQSVISSAIRETLPDLFKVIAKETKDASFKRIAKAIIKNHKLLNSISDANPIAERISKVIQDKGNKYIRRGIRRTTLSQISQAELEMYLREGGRFTGGYLSLFSYAEKLGIPLTDANKTVIIGAFEQTISSLPLDKMTNEVISNLGTMGKYAAHFYGTDTTFSSKWWKSISDATDAFQGGLSKVAFYGTNPVIPFVTQILGRTPVGKAIKAGAKKMLNPLSVFIQKLVNHRAYKFSEQVMHVLGEFTPEAYTMAREAFLGMREIATQILDEGVQAGSDTIVRANRTIENAGTSFYHRYWQNKFMEDVKTFSQIVEDARLGKVSSEQILTQFDNYLIKNYKMDTTRYIEYLKALNKIELDATGIAAYAKPLAAIQRTKAMLDAQMFTKYATSKIYVVSESVGKKGMRLTEAQLRELNPNVEVITIEQYNKMQHQLVEQQAFILRDNKVIIQGESYKLFKDDYEEFLRTGGNKPGFFATLDRLVNESSDNETFFDAYQILTHTLNNAQNLDEFFTLLRTDSGIYAVLKNATQEARDELYNAMTDAFMGLASKVQYSNNAYDVYQEFVTTLQLELESRGILQNVDQILNDADFKNTMLGYIDNYIKQCPEGKFVINEVQDLGRVLETLQANLETAAYRGDPDAIELYDKLQQKLDKLKEIKAAASDRILILPSEAFRMHAEGGIRSIIDGLMQAANGDLPETLTRIYDSRSVLLYFGDVSKDSLFDTAVIEGIQDIATNASHIYDRVYYKITDQALITKIAETWNEVIATLERDPGSLTKYTAQYLELFKATQGLDATRKYTLLKAIYENTAMRSEDLGNLHLLVKDIVDAPDYADIKRAIKNFKELTNSPVVVGTRADINKIERLEVNTVTRQANELKRAQEMINRSAAELEETIKLVQDSDVMLAEHLVLTRNSTDFYYRMSRYKDAIEGSIDTQAIADIRSAIKMPNAANFFTAEDIATVEDLFNGVTDIDTTRIEVLIRHQEEYNRHTLPIELFNGRFLKDAQKRGIKIENEEAFLEQAKMLYRQYKSGEKDLKDLEKFLPVFKEYDDYISLMTKPTLTEDEWSRLIGRYHGLVFNENGGRVPNALKNQMLQDFRLTNHGQLHIRFDTTDTILAAKHNGRRLIELVFHKHNLQADSLERLQQVARHEIVHQALAYLPQNVHEQVLNQFWEFLMKSDNKEFAEQLYATTWLMYRKKNHYSLGNTFTYNNAQIREEVLSNILGFRGTDQDYILNNYYAGIQKAIKNGDLDKLGLDPETAEYFIKLSKQPKATFKSSQEFLEAIDTENAWIIQQAINNTPNKIFNVQGWHAGDYIDISKPYAESGAIMRSYRNASAQRLNNMIKTRLSQAPEEFAKDLARTGPFQFYSITDLQQRTGRYTLNKYFSIKDGKVLLNGENYKALEELGVHIKVFEDQDIILFYIDKDKVAFVNGANYYNRTRIDYAPFDFDYGDVEDLTAMGRSFNDTAYRATGQATGYSDGFRVDQSFIRGLFEGVNPAETDFPAWAGLDTLAKGLGSWTLDDLSKPAYFSMYRFNEMIMGDIALNRRLGMYYSNNPVINMNNAMQQMHLMNKAKVEMQMLYWDDMFSIKAASEGGKGLYANYSDEVLYKYYQDHNEMTLMTITGKTGKDSLPKQESSKFTKAWLGKDWNPMRFTEVVPLSLAEFQKARAIGARFVPRSWLNRALNTVNHRIGSGGILKYWNRFMYVFKMGTLLTNPMTFVRNSVDTYGKGLIELGDESAHWLAYAWKLNDDYQTVTKFLREHELFTEKQIREAFENGAISAFTKTGMSYEMFQDLKHYEAWGPSTDNLASIIKLGKDVPNSAVDPTLDEIKRRLAAEVVPNYKTLWEKYVDLNSRIFDVANNTIGLRAEKTNRLALYLKATSEGKTREQAFQWIRNVHFDYGARSTAEQVLEMMFPFITFTQKNMMYWFDAIEREPWVAKLLMDYFQAEYSYYDFTPEQLLESKQLQQQILSGNIPLWKSDGNLQSYFKLSPSFADAFNTFINPIEVYKNRVFFPTRAIEKCFTEDYKGQNMMGKQSAWEQALDWTQQLPGNALARRITQSIKQPTSAMKIGMASGAIGYTRLPQSKPAQYGHKLRIRYTYNNNQTYYNRLYSIPYFRKTNIAGPYRYIDATKATFQYKMARKTALGRRILDPYKSMGQRLINNLYLKTRPLTVKSLQIQSPKQKRIYSMTQYRVQRGLFNRSD